VGSLPWRRSNDGSTSEDTRTTADEDYQRPRLLGRRPATWAGLLVLVAAIVAGVWLGFEVQTAKSGLEQARASAQKTKDALLQGNTADAAHYAGDAQSQAQSARDATHTLPWKIASLVPWLGSPLRTGQQISDVVLRLTTEVLKPAAEIGKAIAPSQMLADGRLDVETLRQEEPELKMIAVAAAQIDLDAKAISKPRYLAVVTDARNKLQSQTADIAQLLGGTAIAAQLAPSMMGADGARTYFMGFQTNAEARGTGGLLGGFGILRFENGKPSVDDLGPNTELFDKSFDPISLGLDFDKQYGFTKPSTDIKNSNQSAHFPYAAEIWKSMWAQQSGMNVDGVIAIDPVALSYILGATGPVVMPGGEKVTSANVVELTESTVYNRFPTDQAARKRYLQDVAGEVVKKISAPVKNPRTLFDALGRAVSERRIMVWSSSATDQKLLEQTPLAHIVPDDSAPYAGVVINNLGGNKMDYYLQRGIEYVADGCGSDARLSTVTVRLTNTLKDAAPLSEYVAGRMGFFTGLADNIPKGAMLTSVRLLATKGAKLISVLANDKNIRVFGASERGHPSFEAQVAIPPGKTAVLTFRLSEPIVAGAARVPVQPLVDNVVPEIAVPQCAG